MKAMLLISVLFAGSFANANVYNLVCRGTTEEGDKVRVAGQYQENGGSYDMLSPLVLTGTDMQGSNLFSNGAGGRRAFDPENVTMYTKAGYFVLKGQEVNGSRITIRHKEGQKGEAFVDIDLQPTASKGSYTHTFNRASCTF